MGEADQACRAIMPMLDAIEAARHGGPKNRRKQCLGHVAAIGMDRAGNGTQFRLQSGLTVSGH